MKRFAFLVALSIGLPVCAQEAGTGYVRGFLGTSLGGSAGLTPPPSSGVQDPLCEAGGCPNSDILVGALTSSGAAKRFGGFDAGVAVGWKITDSIRVEGAIDYRTVGLEVESALAADGVTPLGIAQRLPSRSVITDPVGDGRLWTFMVNGLYDILISPSQIVDPYVGVGVGLSNMNLTAYNTVLDGTTTVSNGLNGGNISGFAFNLIAGLSYEFSDGLSGQIEYKYLNVLQSDINGLDGADTVQYKTNYDDHHVSVGLTYYFGGFGGSRQAPPPAPLPAPRQVAPVAPPAPIIECSDQDQSVVIYFGLNKVTLDDESVLSVRNAVDAAGRNSCSVSSVSVVGYTDRSGNAEYNKKLSAKRAGAVRDLVIDLGVSGGLIEITAAGELDTARPAKDGSVDALSRRAEVYIRAN